MPAQPFKNIDFRQIVALYLLLLLGLATIYSATYEMENEKSHLFEKQLLFSGISSLVLIAVISLPIRFFYAISYIFYIAGILLLVLVLLVNRGPEPARWFNFGAFKFQPSEMMKVGLILALARFLDARKKGVKKFGISAWVLVLTAIPLGLIIVEPDLGTAGALAFIFIPIIIMGGISVHHIFMVASPAIALISSISIYVFIAAIFIMFIVMLLLRFRMLSIIVLCIINLAVGFSAPKLWNSLHPYQKQRILTFINPEHDPHGAGYQIIQSKIAIGSGGLWGKGYLKGTQGHLKFLPAGHTDFIFAVFCEETGFVGAIIVISAFFILVYRGYLNAVLCRNKFAQLVIIGGCAYFTSHILINIGMAIGLLPVTGLPLPFMSYGGSSLINSMVMAGLMVGMGMRKKEY
jgi:rod shape determining protein RodA